MGSVMALTYLYIFGALGYFSQCRYLLQQPRRAVRIHGEIRGSVPFGDSLRELRPLPTGKKYSPRDIRGKPSQHSHNYQQLSSDAPRSPHRGNPQSLTRGDAQKLSEDEKRSGEQITVRDYTEHSV